MPTIYDNIENVLEPELKSAFQTSPRSLSAFNKSPHADDWRELMRLFLVRRTRGFIKTHYSKFDDEKQRYYLEFSNGTRNYFPNRIAKKAEYPFDEHDKNDPYAQLYSETIVEIIDRLNLPRYGLLDDLNPNLKTPPTVAEQGVIENLTRAGKRLKGFARTNLFKRLESGGEAQFADTADYLERYFKKLGVTDLACVTGKNKNPTEIACRFSPKSNPSHEIKPEDEVRLLITTDVLSEGQNLQDAHIVVNYDLPWAIIRLIQRAGRVDRIGQQAETILCYSFLPEDGIEKIIQLRSRLMQRIEQNADVVGSDEQFFDGDPVNIHDLYSEKNNLLDEYEDEEIDLPSFAQQIWNEATAANPKLKTIIPNLPNVVYSAKSATEKQKTGVIVYAKTANDNDVLTWLNDDGEIITQSPFAILNAAACSIDTPIAQRADAHHELILQSMDTIHAMDSHVGGQLGKKTSTRYQTYHRLKTYCEFYAGDIFLDADLKKAIDEIYKYPLHASARERLSRQLKLGTNDTSLVELVLHLRDEGKLSRMVQKYDDEMREPSVICSLGLVK